MGQPYKNPKKETLSKKIRKPKDTKRFEEEDYSEPKKWYEESSIKQPLNVTSVTEQVLIELKEEAKNCNDQEIANYNIKRQKTNSNYQWMKTMMSSGTVSDKIAAHTLAIQDNPICSLETLRNLVGMVKVGKKKECFTVMETLTELFLTSLLKQKDTLQSFHEKPLSAINDLSSGNALTRRKILSAWYFEDQLKEIFTNFVFALNKAAQDTVEKNKEKAITAMFQLLSGNVEQEKNLLAYVVNKLGDPSQKVASKAIYCLTQLLLRHSNKHSNKQEMVLKEIEKLLFRPNVGTRAQYYGLCFLSQFYLSHDYPDIAKKLIELYLAFFKSCIKQGDVDSRMMSAILMGINRAYPYALMEYENMQEHVDTLYRLVHLANFNVAIQVLTLLHHVTIEKMADRFYGALYRKLSDPKLLTTTHQAMFLSLVYKSLKKDTQVNRLKMFIKRLLQVSLCVQPSFACGILYTVSQLIGKKSDLNALILKQTSVNLDKFNDDNDEEGEKYYDIKDEKDEMELKIEKEEQEINLHVKENGWNDKEKKGANGHIATNGVDTATIEIKDEKDEEKPDIKVIEIKPTGPSWVHRSLPQNKKSYSPIIKYNPLARNPLYGGGEFCGYTELQKLKNNFHPTVALYATNIINGKIIKYSGDPLKDFTLIRFLERFVFKNPKKIKAEKAGAHPTLGIRKFYKPKGVKLIPVRSKNYLNANEKSIPVEELFLYNYLQKRYQDKKVKEEEDDSDLESVQSEEFEEMLDKMAGLDNAEDQEDIDFMNEIGDSLKKMKEGKNKKKGRQDENGDSEEENIDDLDDKESGENDDFGDDEEFESDNEFQEEDDDLDLTEDENDEAIDFNSDEDDGPPSRKKQIKKLKKPKDDITSLFASADEFASLLEEEGSSKQKPGSGNVFENKDKASQKQLAWEDKRNQWLRGFNKSVGGSKNEGKKGKFGKKRPHSAKFNNHKSKKLKK